VATRAKSSSTTSVRLYQLAGSYRIKEDSLASDGKTLAAQRSQDGLLARHRQLRKQRRQPLSRLSIVR
jgi:hypothetical protein